MQTIPITENAQLIRTDFSSQTGWESLISIVRQPVEPFIFNMEILDDHEYSGLTVEQLLAMLPASYPHSFIVIADSIAITQPEYPLLVIDLMDEPGRQFRAMAREICSIDNNLSIANMDFADFANAIDKCGVFHGFPEMSDNY